MLLGSVLGLSSCGNTSDGDIQTESESETVYTSDTEDVTDIDDTDNDGSVVEDTEDAEDEPMEAPTAIVENGVALYSIVYPDGASLDTMNAVYGFWNAIYSLTGVNLTMMSEVNATVGGNEKYILIGNTAFPQSDTVRAGLENTSDGYAVVEQGGYIVVAAKSESDLQYAIAHYEAECLDRYDSGSKTLYFQSTERAPSPDFFGFDLSQISRYSIIYGEEIDGLYSVARLLQTEIEKKTGMTVPIYSDTQKNEGYYEIIVGKTRRELSRKVYSNSPYIMNFRMFVENSSLQIACGGTFSARKGAERFVEEILNGNADVWAEGSHGMLADVLASASVPPVDGTDVRIMTLNIMPDRLGAQKYPNVLSVNDRAEIFAGMLVAYTPDVIGLQETCNVWAEQIPYYLDVIRDGYGIDYDFVLESYNGLNNYCPIVYREDKYSLDFAKYEPYAYDIEKALARGYYIRGASQIKLTDKKTGNTFIVVNSHWDHGGGTSTAPTDPQYSQYCADNEAEIVNRYKAQYPDVRIFMTGDFNNHRAHISDILEDFLVTVGGSIASDVARKSGTLVVKGGYQCNDNYLIDENVPREQISSHSNDFIDHVIGANGDFKVLRHDTILVNYCHVLTDHMPVYADIKFT